MFYLVVFRHRQVSVKKYMCPDFGPKNALSQIFQINFQYDRSLCSISIIIYLNTKHFSQYNLWGLIVLISKYLDKQITIQPVLQSHTHLGFLLRTDRVLRGSYTPPTAEVGGEMSGIPPNILAKLIWNWSFHIWINGLWYAFIWVSLHMTD